MYIALSFETQNLITIYSTGLQNLL